MPRAAARPAPEILAAAPVGTGEVVVDAVVVAREVVVGWAVELE